MKRTQTYVIVEPGSTHARRFEQMLETIDAAAGASAFKSQWVSDAHQLAARRRAPEYLESYRLLEYPLDWHERLRVAARRREMDYGCSVYLPGDAARLAPFVDFLKISSFEAWDDALIAEAVATGKRVFVSTGMQTREDLHRYGEGVELLHCVSAYPAPLSGLHLCLLYYAEGTCPYVGFSDHSHDVRVGAWAVAAMCGPGVLEVHVRPWGTPSENRDYEVAFTPDEFAAYLQNIVDVETALGSREKRVQEAERPMLPYRVPPPEAVR